MPGGGAQRFPPHQSYPNAQSPQGAAPFFPPRQQLRDLLLPRQQVQPRPRPAPPQGNWQNYPPQQPPGPANFPLPHQMDPQQQQQQQHYAGVNRAGPPQNFPQVRPEFRQPQPPQPRMGMMQQMPRNFPPQQQQVECFNGLLMNFPSDSHEFYLLLEKRKKKGEKRRNSDSKLNKIPCRTRIDWLTDRIDLNFLTNWFHLWILDWNFIYLFRLMDWLILIQIFKILTTTEATLELFWKDFFIFERCLRSSDPIYRANQAIKRSLVS